MARFSQSMLAHQGPRGPKRGLRAFVRCGRGSTLVEFALLAPTLIVLLLGIVGYGGYFYLAHTVQQLANDAARAAVGGLTSSERQSLASQAVTLDLQSYSFLSSSSTSVTVNDSNGSSLSVSVVYNAAGDPIYGLQGLVPLPSSTINRVASISLGGY